jgi:hypothetical protein
MRDIEREVGRQGSGEAGMQGLFWILVPGYGQSNLD